MTLTTNRVEHANRSALNLSGGARARCRIARQFEEAGRYEAARNALGDLWQRIGERPNTEGLERGAAAEVLLRAGALAGWLGSVQQMEGAQEFAKDLISESAGIFDTLGEAERVA
ncbi:MAG: hypothetical protein ACRD68_15335, partial [Pyrinomonadaceae bacterium]